MIKSMTGFGRAEIVQPERKITVEMKAVNHRYLDLSIKMPKQLNFYEAAIRNQLKQDIQRGKVDVFISWEDYCEKNLSVRYNKEIAQEYFNNLQKLAADFSMENDVRVSSLSRYPEVFSMEHVEEDDDEIFKLVEEGIAQAMTGFMETRIKEGENLREDLLQKLDGMLVHVDYITERSPEIIQEYREKLQQKVADMLGDAQIDENRLLMEVTIFADRVCVDEELVRLRSHIMQTKEALKSGDSIGRKLDFIAQEMNRESNTILSKTTDLEISSHAIDLKTEIEKIREQIQNIE